MSSVAQLALRSASVLVLGLVAIVLVQALDTRHGGVTRSQSAGLELSAESLNFGVVAVDEAASAVLTLTNNGPIQGGALVIENLFLDEFDSQQFTLSHQPPIRLEPKQSIDLTIGFEPTESETIAGQLFISHNGDVAVATVALNGSGRSDNEPEIAAANPVSFPFGKSELSGFGGIKPTSLQFGPDNRLYVATMLGEIQVLTIERTGANNYKVTNKEVINSIKNIPNHNDNGIYQSNVKNRLVTGLLVTGTAEQPVIYVHSSDPRIGGGASGHTTGLDTNSGILSRLTKTNNGWDKLDLVRGLSRSEENHHSNGMALVGTKLYLAAGGNTNMGAPSNNFALLPEYALSAAILEIDLGAIGNNTYDIPTLDDEDRPGVNDANDPFGGNGGKNQAKLVENGPVQVYSPGWRNPYDVIVTQHGHMYSWDNGPNSGWGGAPNNCDNSRSEPGSTQHDALHLITGRGYYAGHPNPTRAHTKNKFNSSNPQAAVPYNNLIECNYYGPGTNGNGQHPQNNAFVSLPRSTTGLSEYTAANFNGQLGGSLLVTSWDNKVYRVTLDSAGQMQDFNVLFSNVGSNPLDVTSLSDSGVFPGTIWVADFSANGVVVYEPDDYEGGYTNACITGSGNDDADGDGFTDVDEQANGTDACSAADVPADVDGDFISDFTDPDDDNDGIADVADPFALDPANGANTPLDIDYQWENDSDGAGFIADLGFSGLMVNGIDNYQTQFDLNEMTIIGAAGVVTVDEVPAGDPINGKNTQQYGFQLGVDVSPNTEVFRAHTRVLAPFSGVTPQPHQSMGMYIGRGDQDNYVKLVVTHNGFQLLLETDGQFQSQQNLTAPVTDAEYIDLMIEVDPASALATGYYAITNNGITEAEQQAGSFVFPSAWLTANTKLAVGIISTSFGADLFPATWDFLTVKKLSDNTSNTAPTISVVAPSTVNTDVPTLLSASVVDDGLPDNTLTTEWSVVTSPGLLDIANAASTDTSVTFSTEGTYVLQLTASDGVLSLSELVTIDVTDDSPVNTNVVYRLNVGGPVVSDTGGDWLNDSAFVNAGNTWANAVAIDSSNVSGVPSALFNTERYDPPAGQSIEWSLPVTPGRYEVRLYFAEIWFGAMGNGIRVFDAVVENETIPGIDVFASVGGNTGYLKTITVDSDSTLNILLNRQSQNPALKGIEVIYISDGASTADNTAPVVAVGNDQSASVGQPVALSATVTDDGLPDNVLDYTWQVVSGPNGAQFADISASDTSVLLSSAGDYVLRLTVSDGELSGSDDLLVSVTAPVVNTAPVVSAGSDQQTTVAVPFVLSGSASDDGLPQSLGLQWMLQSGPDGVVIADDSAAQTAVTFTTAGQYVFRLIATDTELSSFDEVVITVIEETVTANTVVYRINAGGGDVQGPTGLWMADDGSFVAGGNSYGTSASVDTSATPDVPQSVLQTERWVTGTMQWAFPVTAGQYQVNLYFSEIFGGAMSSGARVFDISVEGQSQAGIDIYGLAGALTGTVLSYTVASDSLLDVNLSGVVQNPAIKGIEIIAIDGQVTPQNSAPTVGAGAGLTIEVSEVITLAGSAADDGLPNNQLSAEWTMVSGPAPVQFDTAGNIESAAVFTEAGTYTLQLQVSDGLLSATDTVIVNVTETPVVISNAGEIVYRINAGGPEIPASPLNWQADNAGSNYVNTGKTWSSSATVANDAAANTPASLFGTERYDLASGAQLEWQLPVTDGSYTVKLYFAEIWPGAYSVGKRVFDVTVEGQTLTNIDVFSEAGANTALVKSFDVDASDGVINIAFDHVTENPSIKGIEVIAN